MPSVRVNESPNASLRYEVARSFSTSTIFLDDDNDVFS